MCGEAHWGLGNSGTGTVTSVPNTQETYQLSALGRPKRNMVFIEREGKILVFNSPADAALYVTAEKQSEQPVEATKKPCKTVKKVRAVPEPQIVDTNVLRAFYERIEERPMVRQIDDAIRLHDIETLIALYEKLLIWQEEEDLLTLLMAA